MRGFLVQGKVWYGKSKYFFTIAMPNVRDRTGREVNFMLVKNHKPWFFVEIKLANLP